ncbi:hypothetical protein CDL15_Pgr016001 [Punica granatum]|uniref:Uncharacterized protein n=1 Tax=Punica granatum TaxID=22663 RepID=A0A218XP05_PUNGR|nr:hypothetical protein CDL15_Pgr016001 [Punica granatum]
MARFVLGAVGGHKTWFDEPMAHNPMAGFANLTLGLSGPHQGGFGLYGSITIGKVSWSHHRWKFSDADHARDAVVVQEAAKGGSFARHCNSPSITDEKPHT